MTNDKITSVSMKGLTVHFKKNHIMVMMIMIKIYMHICHVCLVMRKFLVDILVIVRN